MVSGTRSDAMLSEQEIERRLSVWHALSDLFLNRAAAARLPAHKLRAEPRQTSFSPTDCVASRGR